MDRSKIIYGNVIDDKIYKQALKSKEKFIKKYGDDSNKEYYLKPEEVKTLSHMNVCNLVESDKPYEFEDNAFIIGNIRMGFGHYRIACAIASCANALGYKPYWFDVSSFDATGSKMIRYQNDLYSKASRISQKSKLFNKLFWEPLNSEGFRKITYNAKDQKNSELLVPLYANFRKDIPFAGTHVWPSQGAIHAGLTNVINVIPDNWPMGLHLSEGSINTVQTPFAYFGYKMLSGMAKQPLLGIPEDEIKNVGHYIDHELVEGIEEDTKLRLNRINNDKPIRFLISVGGAGAGAPLYKDMMKKLLPLVMQHKVAVFMNFGDHLKMYNYLCKKVVGFKENAKSFFNEYDKLLEFNDTIKEGECDGIYAIFNESKFEAVYSTNLLMRNCDVLVTKPSELAYYPIPKLMIKHIGGHEVYGEIHSREIGDGTFECADKKKINEMIDRLVTDKELLSHLSNQVVELKKQGIYNGAYEVVKLAVKNK